MLCLSRLTGPFRGVRGTLAFLLLVGIGVSSLALGEEAEEYVVVVSPDVAVSNLTQEELRNIFMFRKQFWSAGRPITILIAEEDLGSDSFLLEKIYDMDEDEFREYWIGKMFRAEIAAGPKLVYSADMARDLVGVIPGAITFVPASQVSSDTKVVRIDHLLPGDEGYPLR